MKLGDVLILAVLAFILFLAIAAIIRGYVGIQKSKSFDPSNKKLKIGFLTVSILHMAAGIVITLCYVIAGILMLALYLGR